MPVSGSGAVGNQVVVPTTPAAQTTSSTATSSVTGPGSLGKDDFLKLLMAQMQNQDPLQPADDTQMIAQMAQFSALEAMQNLNATLTQSANASLRSQAAALMGKTVDASAADGSDIYGVVSGVHFETANGNTTAYLQIGDSEADLGSVMSIGDAAAGGGGSASPAALTAPISASVPPPQTDGTPITPSAAATPTAGAASSTSPTPSA